MKDRVTVACILGAVAPLAGEAVSRLLVMLGLGTHDIFQFDSIIVTVNRPSLLYGFIVNLFAGGLTGFLLYLLLEKLGSRNIVFKAVGLSSLAWFAVECFATAYFEGKFIDIRPLGDYGAHLFGALANGIALGLLFRHFLYHNP